MNNRRNLKENLTISNKQRFSIRKFSIGVASVMLGTTLYFMGGVGTSIVHADSVQEQSVQTSKLDTNSAQASSDTSSAEQTSSQNQTSSAQNSQKAVSNASSNTESTDSKTQTSDQVDNATTDKNEASQADNASATNIKTRDNKRVVSDANRAKLTANDAQTKPAQQTAKSDAANSNTLVVQRTKKLTGNAKLLADSKAQTDTKTDSKYSVTDNYPKDLMNYLPSDFDNKQEYAFEWLQNENNNNIILTTNRTGDGVVYVYQDGEKVGTYLARNSSYPLSLYDTIVDNWGYDHTIKIGTVYNDDYAGIVQSNNGYLLNIIYSSHAKDVDNAGSSYSTVSFFVPHKITQTVTYKDSDGHVIDSLTHTQDGLTGQSYTTGLPSGPKYVQQHQYLANITQNGSGLISEFGDGYSCTKDYHDGVSVTFTEHDSEKTGIGTMDYVIYEKSGYDDSKKVVQRGSLAYGQSTNYTNDSGRYTIVNPYVPQTTNIVYQYKELGKVITTYPSGKNTTEVYYTNDPKDPIKIEPVNAEPITGYSAIVKYENKIVSGKNFMPTNLSENTYITYVANDQAAGIKFIDDTTGKTLDTHQASGKFGDVIKFSRDVNDEISQFESQNYKLVSNNFDNQKYVSDNTKNQFEVHFVHVTKNVTRTDKVNRTIHYVYSDGKTAEPDKVQVVNFTEDGVQDLVTGNITWTSAKSQTMVSVDTPKLEGYTPDIKSVASQTVNFGDKDLDTTVTYSANDQAAGIKFIDDTTGKTLDTHQASGKFGDVIKFSRDVNDEISQFESQNYKLVSNNFDNQKYVSDNTKNQFEVHFVHVTKNVTRTDKVNRTIHYVYSDGKTAEPDKVQVVNFTEDGVQDLVTGNITWTSAKSQTMVSVDTPKLEGYTPDIKSVASQTVNFGDKDLDTTVTYSANDQAAGIKFIDDTTGKTLDTHQASGKFGDVIKFSRDVNDEISQFESQNYKLVSNNFDNQKYVSDNTKNQFEVHFVHVTKNVTRTDKVNRTIHYVYSDGKTAEPDKVQVVNFTEDGVQDLVTGNITWTSAKSQTMVSVDTPKLEGYTPDIKSVASQTVNFGDKDLDTTVTYSANDQAAGIKFIDDTTGKTLDTHQASGKFGDVIKFSRDVNDEISQFESQNYKLVSNNFDNQKYVSDNTKNQFEVHFVHVTKNVTRTDKVNRTIHYVYSDGKTAEPDKVQVVNFTEDGVQDLVTGNITWTSAKSQTMVSVDTPKLEGYTPDIKSVASQTVNFGDKDLDTTVTYSANDQAAGIKFIDDTTGKTLDTHQASGKFGDVIKFSRDVNDEISQFESQNYKLVSNNFDNQKYVSDNTKNQFEVHFVHVTKNVTRTDKVNRTIHYVYSDGKTAEPDKVQVVNFTEDGVQDLVTGNITWTSAKSQTMVSVDTPKLEGYTPDIKSVASQTVNFGDPDINVTVHYTANAQKASVTYVDDKTGKTLKVDNLNGVTNVKSGYTTKAAIDTYTGLGYTLVSDDTNGNEVVFDNDDANDQAFTVHLSHGTITVTTENPGKPGEPINPGEGSANYPDGTDKAGLTDTVNRTITYVMSDGSKAPDAVHDSLSYTASKVIDKVTGEVISTEWSKNQDFKDVVSPDVTGYTPDVKTVSNKNVAHDAKDIDVVVTYKADAQKASVTYVDDKTGKTLKVDNLNGVTNAKSGYTTKAAIDTYTGLGYTLVSDDTNGKEVVFDNDDAVDQAFTVHLSHGTITVTPENPGKPGEPVDPDNPDGPKYPDGTDEYQVKRTGTQTIHYVGAGDKTPADNKQTFVFTREITFDEVTGKIISVTPWNVQSHTFGNVDTPVIPGYHADKAVAGGATVTPDDLNKVITVTYAPDGGSGDNPGSNGGGDQGTTPTPDDQPDTTLPSDNNTDKDVEKDKQDKPKKVKKARKIIKTRITKQEHIGNAEKAEPLAEQEHNDQTVASPVKNEANEPQLPQTGEANTSVIGLLGMLVAGFAAILGFESSRSRKHKN
ncbi:mucin-binding protein [Lactobacillus amylovorus]|uniref:mucin-binding protein n=1 Tax=Lactobacillus amylovorus TaxID=1604 RepID=UPI002330F8DD|nr:YSIRK-type signal peptide-containing protein [Lactobacillus amylovorus]MDB6251759.1 YSIRK-type signal peptide-containing protein [Lactobacillus amylovorus]